MPFNRILILPPALPLTQGESVGYTVNPGVTLNTRYGTQFSLTNTTNLDGNQQETATITQPILRGFGFVNRVPWLDAKTANLPPGKVSKAAL